MAQTTRQTQSHTGSDVQTSTRQAQQSQQRASTRASKTTRTGKDTTTGSQKREKTQDRTSTVIAGGRKSTTVRAATTKKGFVTTPRLETAQETTDDVGVSFSISIPITLGAQLEPVRLPY